MCAFIFKRIKTSSIKLIQKVSSFRYAFVNFLLLSLLCFHEFCVLNFSVLKFYPKMPAIGMLRTATKSFRKQTKSTFDCECKHCFSLNSDDVHCFAGAALAVSVVVVVVVVVIVIVSTWANRPLHHIKCNLKQQFIHALLTCLARQKTKFFIICAGLFSMRMHSACVIWMSASLNPIQPIYTR